MKIVASTLRENGMSTFVKWDWIFCAPPLIITEEQVEEGLAIIDKALSAIDQYYEGT